MYLPELCWKLYMWPFLSHLAHLKGICLNYQQTSTPFPFITLPLGATLGPPPSSNGTLPPIIFPNETVGPVTTTIITPMTLTPVPPNGTFPSTQPSVTMPGGTTLPTFPTLPTNVSTTIPTTMSTTIGTFPTLPTNVSTTIPTTTGTFPSSLPPFPGNVTTTTTTIIPGVTTTTSPPGVTTTTPTPITATTTTTSTSTTTTTTTTTTARPGVTTITPPGVTNITVLPGVNTTTTQPGVTTATTPPGVTTVSTTLPGVTTAPTPPGVTTVSTTLPGVITATTPPGVTTVSTTLPGVTTAPTPPGVTTVSTTLPGVTTATTPPGVTTVSTTLPGVITATTPPGVTTVTVPAATTTSSVNIITSLTPTMFSFSPQPTFPTFQSSLGTTTTINPNCPTVPPTCAPISTQPGVTPVPLPPGCPCIDPRVAVLDLLVNALQRGEDCYTPDNIPGNCINLRSCDQAIKMIQQYNQNKDVNIENYIRRAICGYDGSDILICCPSQFFMTTTPVPLYFFSFTSQQSLSTVQPTPTVSPNIDPSNNVVNGRYALPSNDVNKCGMSNASHFRVVGGVNAQQGAWPWIVLLGYRNNGDNIPKFLCGGTLITQKHVITAGHCIKDNLYMVRLGEFDLSIDQDGAVDINVDYKMQHEDYQSKIVYNDIAILRLAQNAPFTDKIRPICLPTSESLRNRDITYYQPFAAGWGALSFRGSYTNILQEVQLPILPLSECEVNYKANFPSQVFDDKVLCVGYSAGGKDTCSGDSGGPLMLPQLSTDQSYYYYNLIGIVSYGFECARPGFPGIYTRVTSYIPWIEQHIND